MFGVDSQMASANGRDRYQRRDPQDALRGARKAEAERILAVECYASAGGRLLGAITGGSTGQQLNGKQAQRQISREPECGERLDDLRVAERHLSGAIALRVARLVVFARLADAVAVQQQHVAIGGG